MSVQLFTSSLLLFAPLFQGPPVFDSGARPANGHADRAAGGGTYRGPGDAVGPEGGGARGNGGNSGSGPNAAPSPAAPTSAGSGSAPRPPDLPTPVSLATESDDGWWLWWEYNKMEFLRPNRLGLWGFPITGDDPDSLLASRSGVARRSLEPKLIEALSDPDSRIRGSAALAVSRIGRSHAVEPLLKALADPDAGVRERAILSLGATGAAEAVLPLLALARDGTPSLDVKERVTPYASPLAIVALGLGRRMGFDRRLDAEVAKIARAGGRGDRDSVANAALMYQVLSPCPELERFAVEIAEDATRSPAVRCRAVESLRCAADSGTLARLQTFLTGPRLDLRRSAALALGAFPDAEAFGPLATAYELESETLTRGLLLVSIGRQGGTKARDHLMRVLRDGEGGMRKWAALGLGILVRTAPRDELPAGSRSTDLDATKAIRDAALREKSREAAPAYWIAEGLARDPQSRPAIREALTHAADPRARMYAATALAMIGGEESAAELRRRIELETSPLVRASIASALGYIGRREDAPALLASIQQLREPGLQGLTATALSFHGSMEAFLALDELARRADGSTVQRAAALEGLGMMLGDAPPLVFAEVSRQSNYTVYSEWVKGLFQVTL